MIGHYTKNIKDSDDLSDARKKQILRYLKHNRKVRYKIVFNMPARRRKDGSWGYPKAVWPILFNSVEEANDFMMCVPLFLSSGRNQFKSKRNPTPIREHSRRLKSAYVGRVTLK